MNILAGFFNGMMSSLTISSPPLYRYPYRNSLEAFRGDWKHIGVDIRSASELFQRNEGESDE